MDPHQIGHTTFRAGLGETLFQEAGDALLLVDPLSERVVDANPMARRLTGLPDEELLGVSVRTLLRQEQDWQDWLTPLPQPMSLPASESFLLRCQQAERWIPVQMTMVRLQHASGVPLTLITLRDRRELLEAQQRWQRVEGEMRRLLVSVRDCLWSCRIDAGGQWSYRYLSPVVQRFTGRPASFFLEDPQTWHQVVEADDRPRWQAFRARLAAGHSAELVYSVRRSDGAVLQVRENVLVAPDENGLVLHGVVSERNEPPAIPSPSLPAAARLRALADLAGHLAHDFNNLLTAILGHVSLARLPAGPGDAMEQIEVIALRAAELCKQLTLFSGKGKGGSMPQDLNRLLADCLAQRGPLPAPLRLRLDVEAHLPPVAGDPTLLRTLLGHLLDNAVEALGASAGSVVVRTQRGDPTLADGGHDFRGIAEVGRPMVGLEVSDDGPGIPLEVQPLVFDPFFSTRAGHRGLGLSVVLGIVHAHHGAIRIDAKPGQGTTVRILLPAAVESVAVSQDAAQRAAQRATTVLLADDEESVLDVTTRLFASLGWRVVQARDGEQALELYRRHAEEIGLAMLDLTMPRLGGMKTAQELHRLCPGLPMILMSGHAASDVAATPAELSLVGYLHKPFRLNELLSLLEQVVGR